MTFRQGTEEYYGKFIELQEKLRRSEEERLKLEMKFNEMMQVTREEEQMYYRHLRSQYKQFLDENKKRQERNERILRLLERIEMRAAMLEAKTERYNFLRRQYCSFLNRVRSRSVPPKLPAPQPPPSSIEQTRRDINMNSYRPNEASTIADEIMSSIYSRRVAASRTPYGKDKEAVTPRGVSWTRRDPRSNLGYASEISNVNSESEEDRSAWQNRRQYYSDNRNCLTERSSLGYPTPSVLRKPSKGEELQNGVQENRTVGASKENGILKSALVQEVPGNVAQGVNEINARLLQDEGCDRNDQGLGGQTLVKEIDAEYNEKVRLPIEAGINRSGMQITDDKTPIYEEGHQLIQDNLGNVECEKNELQVPLPIDEGNDQNLEDVEPLDNQQLGEEQLQSYYANDEYKNIEQTSQQNDNTIVLKEDVADKQTLQEISEPTQYQANGQSVQYEASEESKPVQIEANELTHRTDVVEQPELNVAIDQPLQSEGGEQLEQLISNEQIVGQTYEEASKEDKNAQELQLENRESYDTSGQQIQYEENKFDTNNQQLQYDENGQPINYSDNNQELHYDNNGQPIPYNENVQPINYTDTNQELQFDENGQPLQYNKNVEPINYTDNNQEPQYDENGQPLQYNEIVQPTNNPELQFEEKGQPLQYNENEQPTNYTDNHSQQQYVEGQYNTEQQFGQPINEQQLQYDESGQQIHYDPNNQQLQYDDNGQPINYTDNQQYDENGQPLQYQTEQQYDENGQPIQYDEYNRQINYDENGQPYYYDESGNAVFYEQYEQSEIAADSSDLGPVETSKPNVVELLETDTESSKQDVNKVSNDSDFDFSSK